MENINIDKEILENIDKILNRLEFGISNRATTQSSKHTSSKKFIDGESGIKFSEAKNLATSSTASQSKLTKTIPLAW